MPKEPNCLVCVDAATRVAVDELRAQGKSIRDIASRVKRSRASVWRHVKHSGEPAEKQAASGKTSAGRKTSQARRLASGRCPTCGISADSADPKELIRRAERALHFGEQIVMKAVRDDDDRTALMGLDRVRTSLEQLLKVHGLLVPDSGGAYVDQRRQTVQILAGASLEELRAWAAAPAGHDEASMLRRAIPRGMETEEARASP